MILLSEFDSDIDIDFLCFAFLVVARVLDSRWVLTLTSDGDFGGLL